MADAIKTYLVTGGGGYLGSVLVPLLLEKGHKVKVLDRFFWGKKVFGVYLSNKRLELIQADTRTFSKEYLHDVDVVIDLASLSNDPVGEIDPRITLEINFEARVRTARLAKSMGVKRYILASSCSVYGFQDSLLTERSKPAPVTTYARASLLAEKGVLKIASKDFIVTVLRQGTLYGISPRMRFDLVLNTMVLSLFKNKMISVLGGEQWRPLLHVHDAARAFILVSESEMKKIQREIFNVGSQKQNFTIKKLAQEVASAFSPQTRIVIQEAQSDFRSYRVSFDKIIKRLKYRTIKNPKNTAKELLAELSAKRIKDSIETKTIHWYKKLISKNPHILEKK